MKPRSAGWCLAVALSVGGCEPKPPLPEYWAIPNFKLTERSGQTFDSTELAGKVWVASFFFSSCPGVCPVLNQRMALLQREFAGDARVQLISISTDPETDTPEVLRGYAEKFQAGPNWRFLTGDKATIWQLSKEGFRLAVAESPGAPEPITHATRLVVIDRRGVCRGFYEGIGEPGPERMVADIRRLLSE